MVLVSPDSPHSFQFKVNFEDDDALRRVDTRNVGIRPVNFSTYQFKLAYYDGPLPISKAKHKDLMFYTVNKTMCQMKYHDFYESLKSDENVVDGKDDEMPEGRARQKRARKKPTN